MIMMCIVWVWPRWPRELLEMVDALSANSEPGKNLPFITFFCTGKQFLVVTEYILHC